MAKSNNLKKPSGRALQALFAAIGVRTSSLAVCMSAERTTAINRRPEGAEYEDQ